MQYKSNVNNFTDVFNYLCYWYRWSKLEDMYYTVMDKSLEYSFRMVTKIKVSIKP